MENCFEIDLGAYKAIVDIEDMEKVSSFKWRLGTTKSKALICYTTYYEAESRKKKNVWLHQIIKPKPKNGLRAVFKDGNRLNCRKENIEYISSNIFGHSLIRNKRGTETNSELYFRGVVKVFKSRIKHNKKVYHLGTFDNLKDAAIAYNRKAIELYGVRAKLNDI
jgi:AP2-like factor, euAP2 lineage